MCEAQMCGAKFASWWQISPFGPSLGTAELNPRIIHIFSKNDTKLQTTTNSNGKKLNLEFFYTRRSRECEFRILDSKFAGNQACFNSKWRGHFTYPIQLLQKNVNKRKILRKIFEEKSKMSNFAQAAAKAKQQNVRMTFKIKQLDYRQGTRPREPPHYDILSFMNVCVGVKPEQVHECYFTRGKDPGEFFGRIELLPSQKPSEEKTNATKSPHWVQFGRTADGKAAYEAQMHQNNIKNGRKFRIHFPGRYGFTAYDKNAIYTKLIAKAPLKGRILDETYGRGAPGGLDRINNGHWCFFTENQPEDFTFDFSGITHNGIELIIYEVESVEARVARLVAQGVDAEEARNQVRNEKVRKAAQRQIQKEKNDAKKAEEAENEEKRLAEKAKKDALTQMKIGREDHGQILEKAEEISQRQKELSLENKNEEFNKQVEAEIAKMKEIEQKAIEESRKIQEDLKKQAVALALGAKNTENENQENEGSVSGSDISKTAGKISAGEDDRRPHCGHIWDFELAKIANDVIDDLIRHGEIHEAEVDANQLRAIMYFIGPRKGGWKRSRINNEDYKIQDCAQNILNLVNVTDINEGKLGNLRRIAEHMYRAGVAHFPSHESNLWKYVREDDDGILQQKTK